MPALCSRAGHTPCIKKRRTFGLL